MGKYDKDTILRAFSPVTSQFLTDGDFNVSLKWKERFFHDLVYKL